MDHNAPLPLLAFQKKQLLVSLLWMLVAAAIGSLLRWHFVWPITDLPFAWWRHAHSHLAFLGWVGNALLAFLLFDQPRPVWARNLWWFSQLLVLGMAISFPLSGYSRISIIFSTLHIFCCWVFAGWWFVVLRKKSVGTVQLASNWAFALMAVSQLGPIGLGMSMVFAPENNRLYEFFLHYYLYFQHSGWFILGTLAAWLKYQGRGNNTTDWLPLVRWIGYYVLIYFSASYGKFENPTYGFVLGLLSLMAAYQLLIRLPLLKQSRPGKLHPGPLKWLGILLIISWAAKIALENAFLLPHVHEFAAYNHFFQLGFLHLNFLGITTPVIVTLIFQPQEQWSMKWPVIIYLAGASITILLLFASGSPLFHQFASPGLNHTGLLIAACFLLLAFLLFCQQFVRLRK